MFNLSSYLEKFKKLKDPKENKAIICRAIFEISGVEIKEEHLTLQKETVFIKADSLSKSRIFLCKEKIIECANKHLSNVIIKEII